MSSIWGENAQNFYQLTPDIVEDALENLGIRSNAQVLALNSMENRVFQVGLEDDLTPHIQSQPDNFNEYFESLPMAYNQLVLKFYRLGRWSEESILEEHDFSYELAEMEIPVIPPIKLKDKSLHRHESTGLYYAIYPKVFGRLQDEISDDQAKQMGRLIARIHNIGNIKSFSHRPTYNLENYLFSHLETFKQTQLIPDTSKKYYIALCEQLAKMIQPYLERLTPQRLHGDFHRGNIIWSEKGGDSLPWIIDLDDCSQGPREQDLWLLLPGRDSESLAQREIFLEAYLSMSNSSISLTNFIIEALRSIRMIHFNGWIAKRWEDPIFQNYYPDFNTENYWQTQLLDLREQISILQDSLYE